MSPEPTPTNGAGDGRMGAAVPNRVPNRDMPPPRGPIDSRSVSDLLRELSGEGAELVRQEVALVKAEMSEKLDLFKSEVISMAVGGAFLLAALLFFLWAVNSGLTALLVQFMAVEVAIWLSPLILAGILALAGMSMTKSAAGEMKREGITPSTTKRTLEADKRWAQDKARQVKEEMNHG